MCNDSVKQTPQMESRAIFWPMVWCEESVEWSKLVPDRTKLDPVCWWKMTSLHILLAMTKCFSFLQWFCDWWSEWIYASSFSTSSLCVHFSVKCDKCLVLGNFYHDRTGAFRVISFLLFQKGKKKASVLFPIFTFQNFLTHKLVEP